MRYTYGVYNNVYINNFFIYFFPFLNQTILCCTCSNFCIFSRPMTVLLFSFNQLMSIFRYNGITMRYISAQLCTLHRYLQFTQYSFISSLVVLLLIICYHNH